MTARIISGTEIAQQVRREISIEVEHLRTKTGAIPGLAAVLVGDDPASQIYVRNKGRACKEVGIHSEAFHLPASFTENKLLDLILELNSSRSTWDKSRVTFDKPPEVVWMEAVNIFFRRNSLNNCFFIYIWG